MLPTEPSCTISAISEKGLYFEYCAHYLSFFVLLFFHKKHIEPDVSRRDFGIPVVSHRVIGCQLVCVYTVVTYFILSSGV